MKIYRILGAWYHRIDCDEEPAWTDKSVSIGMLPTCPIGIHPDVFRYFMNYAALLSYHSLGRDLLEQQRMFLADAMSEINATAQHRAFYRWIPGTVVAARLKFDLMWAVKVKNPVVKYDQFEDYGRQMVWMTYQERVWWGQQQGWYGEAAEHFIVGDEFWDVLCFLSRDSHKTPGYPDRVCTGYLLPRIEKIGDKWVVKYYYRAAMIFLGFASHVGVNLYRLRESYRGRACLLAPTDSWEQW